MLIYLSDISIARTLIMAKRKHPQLEAGEMPIEDNLFEVMTPPDMLLEEVDRNEAGIQTDPADWMTQNADSIKEDNEMNGPEEFERGEANIMSDPSIGLSQSATTMLRADHARVNQLFEQYLASGDTLAADVYLITQQVCEELEVHAHIEEELFYPTIMAAADPDTESFVQESIQTHDNIKNLITDVRTMPIGSPEHDHAFRELINEVTAHIEQEETMLLPFAEDVFGDELIQLGEEMLARKEQIMAMGDALFSTDAGSITETRR